LLIVVGKIVSSTMPPRRTYTAKRRASANEESCNVQGKTAAADIVAAPTNPGGGSVLTETTNAQQKSQPSTTSQPTTTSWSFVVGGGAPKSVPLVVAVNTNASVVTAQGDTNVKAWFEACQNSGCLNNTAMLHKDISSYVRYALFPNLKFIMAKSQMDYLNDSTTLCNIICSAMGMLDLPTAVLWCEHWKDMIADVLNANQANVTGAMKKVFVRKF
jgi:hypothetical protein